MNQTRAGKDAQGRSAEDVVVYEKQWVGRRLRDRGVLSQIVILRDLYCIYVLPLGYSRQGTATAKELELKTLVKDHRRL